MSKTYYTLEDAAGDTMDLSLADGVDSDNMKYIYLNGQCLALAVQLSEALGTNKILMVGYEEEYDTLDEQGEPMFYISPTHVYAVDAKGSLWDIDGEHKVSPSIDSYEVREYENTTDAIFEIEGFLPEQDYDFAKMVAGELVKQ